MTTPAAPTPTPKPPPGRGNPRALALVGVLAVLAASLFWVGAQDGSFTRRAEQDVKRAEQAAEKDLHRAEAEARKRERKAGAEARHLEQEAVAEGEKLKQEAGEELHRAEQEARTLEAEAEEEAANVAEEGMSAARQVLRDLSDHSPDPVAVDTFGDFQSALPDTPEPLQISKFPHRPPPFLETGNPYFGKGYISPGFQSLTGAWWQPQFFMFGTYRTGVQTFDNGVNPRITEWVNRLDLYANLNLTPTERFIVGVRPLDTKSAFSGYQVEPEGEWLDATNGRINTLFFEGNFLSLFPGLDDYKNSLLYFDFSVGRQAVTFQNGILLNDNIDMVGITHPSLFWLGGSATTATFVYGWGNLHRGDNVKAYGAQTFGWALRNDYPATTVEADFFYTVDEWRNGGDGAYLGLSGIQRFGVVNTTFRVNGSKSLEDRANPLKRSAIDDGILLFSEISLAPPGTENVLYLNTFWDIGNFTSVSRAPDAGGPLGQTGILFAATGLGRFGAALGANPADSVGSALGYQIFFDEVYSKQLVLEIGAKTQTWGPENQSFAYGFQYQMKIAQRWLWTVGAVGAVQSVGDTLYGARTEFTFLF